MSTPPAFVCPICKRQSWNQRDAKERFCSVCKYVDDHSLRAQAAYFDPKFDLRDCDHCGHSYQGPAVYCCLTCAIASA